MTRKNESTHEGAQSHDTVDYTARGRILSILQGSTKEHPVRRSDLVKQSGVNDRDMRMIIESLRRDGNPILSKAGTGGGYWLAESDAEINAFTKEYLAHCFSGIVTINRMRRGLGLKNQLKMGDVIHE